MTKIKTDQPKVKLDFYTEKNELKSSSQDENLAVKEPNILSDEPDDTSSLYEEFNIMNMIN